MHLISVTVSGFRSFGADPVCVELAGEVTTVVGPNASGKTALLQALARMFGVSRAIRTIHRSDFHLPPDIPPDDRSTRNLFVDVVIALPELAKKKKATAHAVAPAFKHLLVPKPKATPTCRLRLEAQWEDDGTPDGEVTQELYWVTKLDGELADTDKVKVAAAERGYIQVYYTPASRDAAAHIRTTTGALAARLLKAIKWSDKTRDAVHSATQELGGAFSEETAVKAITTALSDRWSELEGGSSDTDPSLNLISRRFEDVITKIQVLFSDGPSDIQRGLDALSDGQQSLFYFALASAVFDLERQAVAGEIDGFMADEIRVPALSIFAIEEPENHLSPYFLSRIVTQIRTITSTGAAQAIVTSHSPAVLSRVEPAEVRYCRRDPESRISSIKSVALPTDDEEAVKFIRGAMLAFPELYFARFVMLVEGDSERIVLPRLAEAKGLILDPSFVAVVPLGGRHVQHFWRLLKGLSIPFATLLDLDLGRHGGGYGRVKNAIAQLLANGVARAAVLTTSDDTVMSEENFSKMHERTDEHLSKWASHLRKHGVFFSEPLDLDMAMLAAFPAAYEKVITEGSGPKMTKDAAAKVVLGEGGLGLAVYTGALEPVGEQMPNYRYHFLTRSKPATHLQAVVHLDDAALDKDMPEPYRALLDYIEENLKRD